MIRIAKWAGLLSAASPYILPSGGAVEQINAQSSVPGQLTVRGGMTEVKGGASTGAAMLELWGYSTGSNQTEIIFAFTDGGEILQVRAPAIEYADPVET